MILKNGLICFTYFSLHSKCLKLAFLKSCHILLISEYLDVLYGIEEIAIYIGDINYKAIQHFLNFFCFSDIYIFLINKPSTL